MIRLGCIADDFTGATDLANNLAQAGMRVLLQMGIVPADAAAPDADAIVIALKTRTIAAQDAVTQSLQACRTLKSWGAGQIYFKVCSTFDSTVEGNIGPVADALMRELNCSLSAVAIAFPENARTVYQGYLFTGSTLLSDGPMRHHPLTPMRDSSLVRLLQAQLPAERKVGLVPEAVVSLSSDAVRSELESLRAAGIAYAVIDCVSAEDLTRLGEALADAPLVTASSGLGSSLPPAWGFKPSPATVRMPHASGREAILAGSCSAATERQVAAFLASGGAARRVTPLQLAEDPARALAETMLWAREVWSNNEHAPLLVHSTARGVELSALQEQLGVDRAGALVETFFSKLVTDLAAEGLGRLIVAGGETSGACVQALGITSLRVGPQIDPGVPWCYTERNGRGLHLALKSGNFGTDDFFLKALQQLDNQEA